MPIKYRRRRRKKFFGLISKRDRWGLSLQGWLTVLAAIAFVFWSILFKLEPFLAYTAPVEADILIVEGWIGDKGDCRRDE